MDCGLGETERTDIRKTYALRRTRWVLLIPIYRRGKCSAKPD
jgi:hypothetical protein